MSGASTSAGDWSTKFIPAPQSTNTSRPDDPRLGDFICRWQSDPAAFNPGQPVLVGFPQDEGVRRNAGRPGAALAPDRIRHFLDRLTPWDGQHDADLGALRPLDLGNLIVDDDLEASQALLGQVVAAILRSGAIPIVLGGGHEEAFGHYLGYVAAQRPVGIVNLDAHLDVRPLLEGKGHSGSPFRQALAHDGMPLPGSRYSCLGAQPPSVARDHLRYVCEGDGRVVWDTEARGRLRESFHTEYTRLLEQGCSVYLTIDADVVSAAEVPGVSAPNPSGLCASEVAECARLAGQLPGVSSLDVVEINPLFDVDGRSARWAAWVVWHFLSGLALRPG